ncbi:MAG: DUF4388 domain-containing protein [Frankiaceae bacterium]
MLRGNLATLPLEALLRDLTGTAATGCLHLLPRGGHLRDDAADEIGAEPVGHGDEAARIYLCDGGVCAAFLPDWTRRLGNRLVSLGLLAPDVLAAVLQAQQGELIDWQLAELLVNLGYIADDVAEDAVGAAALEEMYEAVSQLSRCTNGRWRFRRNERCRAASSRGGVPRQSVDSLLAEVARRDRVWAGLLPVVGGLDAIPALAVGTTPDSRSLDRLTWALLCKVDGVRAVRELARACGLSRWEAACTIGALVEHGVLDVVDLVSADTTGAEDDQDGEVAGLVSADGTRAAISAIAAALAGFYPPRVPVDPEPTPTADDGEDAVAASLARLSEALRPAAASKAETPSTPVELAAVVDLATRRPSSPMRRSEPQAAVSGGAGPAADDNVTQEAGDECADSAFMSEAFLELAAAQQPTPPLQPATAGVPVDAPSADACVLAGEGREGLGADDGLTDRFSLMRELSSLGVEDAQTPLTPPQPGAARQQPKPRQQPGSAPQRKRKGLFSRS